MFGLVGYSRAVEYESLLSKVKGSLHLDMIEGKVPVLREEEELRWHFFKLSQVTDTHSYNYNEPETCRCSFYKSLFLYKEQNYSSKLQSKIVFNSFNKITLIQNVFWLKRLLRALKIKGKLVTSQRGFPGQDF